MATGINDQPSFANASVALAQVFEYLAAGRAAKASRWARKLLLWLQPIAETGEPVEWITAADVELCEREAQVCDLFDDGNEDRDAFRDLAALREYAGE